MRKELLQSTTLGLFALLLFLAGCEDEEKDKALAEAEQARVSLTRVKAQLARAEREIADLNESLETVKQNRDELASQVAELSRDRGIAFASSQEAQEMARSLSARSSEQNASAAALQGQINDLASLVESQERTIAEQNETIDELLKTVELLQGSDDDNQGQSDVNDLG